MCAARARNASVLTTQIMTATALYVPSNLPCTNLNFRTATTGNTVPIQIQIGGASSRAGVTIAVQ